MRRAPAVPLRRKVAGRSHDACTRPGLRGVVQYLQHNVVSARGTHLFAGQSSTRGLAAKLERASPEALNELLPKHSIDEIADALSAALKSHSPPIIPADVCDELLAAYPAAGSEEKKARALVPAIKGLHSDESAFALVSAMCTFLSGIETATQSLDTVTASLAPSLLRSSSRDAAKVMHTMVEQHFIVFSEVHEDKAAIEKHIADVQKQMSELIQMEKFEACIALKREMLALKKQLANVSAGGGGGGGGGKRVPPAAPSRRTAPSVPTPHPTNLTA